MTKPFARDAADRGDCTQTQSLRQLDLDGPDGSETDAALAGLTDDGLIALRVPQDAQTTLTTRLAKSHRVEVCRTDGSGHVLLLVQRFTAQPVVDLRDRPAPQPLEAYLEGVSKLATGGVFIARLPRYPRMLFLHLDARGLRHEHLMLPDGTALVHARRARLPGQRC